MKRRVAAPLGGLLLIMACGGSEPAEAVPGPEATVVQVSGEVCRRDAIGSGILIDDELVLTSAHVVAGSEGGLRARRPHGESVAAQLVGFDAERDLALLAAPGLEGEVVVWGTPQPQASGVIGTVTNDGTLELLGYTIERRVNANSGDIYDEGEVTRAALQLSASTLPGDSGGALFDDSNRVVGIVFAQSRETDNVAYALAIEEVEAFLAGVDPTTEASSGRCR